MYYIIPIIIGVILNACIEGSLSFIRLGGSSSIDLMAETIARIIYYIIYLIIFMFIGSIFMYGLTACSMDMRRGQTVGFKTIFTKIKKRFGKVIKLILWSIFEVIVYIAALIIAFLLNIWAYNSYNDAFSLLTTILGLGVVIFVVYNSVKLFLSIMYANYLIYDYPEQKARRILKKAKKLEGKLEGKYITLILSNIWILLIFILNILLIYKIDYFIFQPKLLIGYDTQYISSSPIWWSIAVAIFSLFSVLYIFMKSMIWAGSLYESIEPERIFEDDYKIEKQGIKYVFISLGLIILYIAIPVLFSVCYNKFFEGAFKSRWPENSFEIVDIYGNKYNYYRGYMKNTSEDKIKVESVGFAENGDLILKVRNEDDIPAYIANVTIECKNESGHILATEKANETYFMVNAKSEIYIHSSYLSGNYENYDFSVEMGETDNGIWKISTIYEGSVLFDAKDIEVSYNDTGKKLIFELNNKTKYDLDEINMSAIFYKNNKIVGITTESISNVYKGNKAYFEVSYLYDKNYDNLEFDDCKIQFNKVDIAQINDEESSKIINNIKIEQKEIAENGDLVLKIKNNNDELVNIGSIYTIFKDENGKLCRIDLGGSNFKIKANSDSYICNDSSEIDYSKYSNMELYVKLASNTTSYFDLYIEKVNEDDIELSDIKKDDCIEVTVKNNGEVDVENLTLQCIFYRDKKIVAYEEEGISSWYDDEIKAGESTTIEIDFPTIKLSTIGYSKKNVEFDEYEVRLLSAK